MINDIAAIAYSAISVGHQQRINFCHISRLLESSTTFAHGHEGSGLDAMAAVLGTFIGSTLLNLSISVDGQLADSSCPWLP